MRRLIKNTYTNFPMPILILCTFMAIVQFHLLEKAQVVFDQICHLLFLS